MEALIAAVTGQRGDPGILGRGMLTSLSRNRIVLLHLMVRRMPQGRNLKSAVVNCLVGLNRLAEEVRNRLKKATRQVAQNEASKLQRGLSLEWMSCSRWSVMGSFWLGG